MRLLLVLNDPADFHANRLGLARAARQAGWEVHVAAPDEPAGQAIAADGWPFHPVALDRLGMAPSREAAAVLSIARLVRRLRPTVLHLRAVKPILTGGLATLVAPSCGVVSHFCGLGYLFTGARPAQRLLRLALRPALRAALSRPHQRVVVQNADDADTLLRAGLVEPGRLALIPGSGVDCERFRPAPTPPGPFTVVLPARLLRAKGVAEFAEAGRLLADRRAAVRLELVGPVVDGNRDAIPDDALRAWQAAGWLTWSGPAADMREVYARAHAVCLPSWREGLPQALLEGAACGLPLIASDAPGCRLAVTDGRTGLLVPPRDPAALAEAIARLAGDPQLCRRLGEAGRLRAIAEFSLERITAAFLALYGEVGGPAVVPAASGPNPVGSP
jgi:glycosyltransferase involved in cell wall biosynthesis